MIEVNLKKYSIIKFLILISMSPHSYIDLLSDFQNEIQTQELKPFSFIIYGSVSRGDMTVGYSDVDILYVIKDLIPDSVERQKLYHITASLYTRYGIKIHLRIRSIRDLYNQTAGLLDCGFTSCMNKLRDGICLWGTPIDNIYLDYIKSASLQTIQTNLTQRFSKLKYDIRALTSPQAAYSNHVAGYQLYTMVSQLAELIVYSNGSHFINKRHALKEAYNITSNDIFNIVYNLRLSSITIDKYFDSLCVCERLIDDAVHNLNPRYLERLKLIEINYPINICVNENEVLRKSYLFELFKCKGIIKKPLISDGKLVINQYTTL